MLVQYYNTHRSSFFVLTFSHYFWPFVVCPMLTFMTDNVKSRISPFFSFFTSNVRRLLYRFQRLSGLAAIKTIKKQRP